MENYLQINKDSWNRRTEKHYGSEFYKNNEFIRNPNSLNSIELELLGDVKGKTILHLQCHFGQDTISLEKLGAKVVGVDFSDKAIDKAKELAKATNSSAHFMCCDVYTLPELLDQKFDIVFTSYGTIGWLPDINKWASVVSHFIQPKGTFVFAEFHPVIWMFDNDFNKVEYRYFKSHAIIENETTYADDEKTETFQSVSWNHALSEVIQSLLDAGLNFQVFKEFDYSPYNCLSGLIEVEKGKFQLEKMENRLPMVYALKMLKLV